MKCRSCDSILEHTFLDLGFAPPSNSYLSIDDLNKPETYYPLKVKVCHYCWLVQTEDYAGVDELFSDDYAYFSSTSLTWVSHAKQYCERIIDELGLNSKSFVIEVASNDGYLLRNFLEKSIPCLGIEPTASTAKVSKDIGLEIVQEFFSEKLAVNLQKKADLIIGNNVFAHVPNINDFTRGLKTALKPEGVITLEFPHLLKLIEFIQFDTIYHEHFSYLSLITVSNIFKNAGLRIWKVEELSTHGGSLRVFGCHFLSERETQSSVYKIIEIENKYGLSKLDTYMSFQEKVEKVKDDFLIFLITQKKLGKKIAAYGAAAKGNTLLNYAGIKTDLLSFVCDAAMAKQNKYMPGSHLPILSPDAIYSTSLDYLLILPWNITDEVIKQNIKIKMYGTKFLIAIPELKFYD